jgi:hypothetical protein
MNGDAIAHDEVLRAVAAAIRDLMTPQPEPPAGEIRIRKGSVRLTDTLKSRSSTPPAQRLD